MDDKLIVSGNANEDNDSFDWLYKGIATRNFTRTFALDDKIEIKDAFMVNGMLKIALEKIIPEHKKPKKIEVKEGESETRTSKSNKQLLLEKEDETETN